MPLFLTILLLLFVFPWIVGKGTWYFSKRRRQRKLLSQLVRQFGGLYLRGTLFRPPSLRFRYGETWVVASVRESRGPFAGQSLQVRVQWPHTRLRCEVISRIDTEASRNYVRRWPLIEFGDEFGSQFAVHGPDATEVHQLLTSGVRWQFERLSNVGPGRWLHVMMRDGSIQIQKPFAALRGDAPAQFVQGALELYDQCMLAKATGIQFLHTDEAQTLDHVICKVCGEEIQDQMVVCRRCKTPHHLDCWHYTGACSVFGCRETQYLQPPVSRT